jgi:hypothetical protein
MTNTEPAPSVERPQEIPTLLTNSERLYSPTAAAKASKVPGHRGNAHLNGSTLFRHIVKGVRAGNGQVIRLEAVRVGGRWLTSLEAIARFAEKLTAASIPSDTPPAPAPTPKQRQRAAKAASAQADAIFGAKSGK